MSVDLEAEQVGENDWMETLYINNKPFMFKLDTGAQCNVIPMEIYRKIGDKKTLKKSKVTLKSYTKEILKPVGETRLTCVFNGTRYTLSFQVVEGNYAPILGRQDCVKLQMVTRKPVEMNTLHTAKEDFKPELTTTGTILDEFPDLFDGLGTLPGVHKIKVDPTVTPVVYPPRRVPHALKKKLKAELQSLESQGIIEKVPNNEPCDWVNSLVVVEKPDGGVRLCIDPKELNKAIKREHHPLTTVDDIIPKVNAAKFFTLLDAKSAFHQICVDEDSSKLLTFNSEFGRYRYCRMPYGIKSASEVFQRRIQEVIDGIDGTAAGMDDILLWGDSAEEHDSRLKKLLLQIRQSGLKLNKEKCKIKQKEVKFHGHIFTREGVKPTASRCSAIRNMFAPESKEEVKRFLGMVNYVGKFIPNLSQLSAPLRETLKKDVQWHWSADQENSFESLKSVLQNPPVLSYYNENEELILQVDASSKGIGAALIQKGNPIAYASRSLTETQQGYSQMEKELLAILFGCTKFQDYIIGRETLVETDHKPLESIIKKPLFRAPLRLQRMLIQLQRYPGISVVYKKGSQMHIADALSRNFSQKNLLDFEELHVSALQILPISQNKLSEMVVETDRDPVLRDLKQIILEGWPEHKKDVPTNILEYWNYRDELTIIDNLIFKGDRLVIPKCLRKEMLDKLHESHQGIVKTKQRAREIIYWPRLNSEIEDTVQQCSKCAEYQRSNPKEPLICHTIPSRPWAEVATDLFEHQGKTCLVCVDFYSKFPEVILLNSQTSATVITALKTIFARHGIPDMVYSDCGPQYTSAEFKNFSTQWGFSHTQSSPYYAQSNGQAERTVQTVKNMLKKASDPYIALLEYRNTPLDGLGVSPAQLLMSRQLKSILPVSRKLLKPQIQTKVSQKMLARQSKQKAYFDRTVRSLPPMHVGDVIRYKKNCTWKRGEVVKKLPYRSYIVRTEDNATYRRNRSHLQPAHETLPFIMSPDDLPLFPAHQDQQECTTQAIQHQTSSPDTDPIPNNDNNRSGVNVSIAQSPNIQCSSRTTFQTRRGRVVRKPNKLDL